MSGFLRHVQSLSAKIYIRKNVKQGSTARDFWKTYLLESVLHSDVFTSYFYWRSVPSSDDKPWQIRRQKSSINFAKMFLEK